MNAEAEKRAVTDGLHLARDLLIAQRRGRAEHMLPSLNETEPATLGYALQYMAAITDHLVMHAARQNPKDALELVLTATRRIDREIASTVALLDRLSPAGEVE